MMEAGVFDQNSFVTGIPLSRLTDFLTRAINSHPELFGVWVTAELSDVNVKGGHCYLELIEKDDNGKTLAKLRATIWQSTFLQLRNKFLRMTGKDISTGLKVLVRGNANHHNIYGLSFNITDIDPSYTLGDMERLRREILLRLKKEGILEINKTRALPLAPQRIAVISAEGAAGYGDFINHLNGNREGFVFYPCLFPCVMQGDKVSGSIRNALAFIESTPDLWDCVAIVRGGGATTDLNGFDDYDLAKAVATCGLPVIVGIGHDRDRNVLDEIAHTSLKTPTAVAGFFIDRLREAYEKVLQLTDVIRDNAAIKIRGEETRLTAFENFVPQLVLRKLEDSKAKVLRLSHSFPIILKGRVDKENEILNSSIKIIDNLAAALIAKSSVRLDEIKDRLHLSCNNIVASASLKLTGIENLLKVLDPMNTLKRGYSVTRINGKAITSARSVSKGDRIITSLDDGVIESVVD